MNMNKLELNDLMVCAFRYALGRRSYIVYTIADLLIKHKDELSDSSKWSITRDIKRAFATDSYGMECDRKQWQEVLEELDAFTPGT